MGKYLLKYTELWQTHCYGHCTETLEYILQHSMTFTHQAKVMGLMHRATCPVKAMGKSFTAGQ
jgi:hypothetical protein